MLLQHLLNRGRVEGDVHKILIIEVVILIGQAVQEVLQVLIVITKIGVEVGDSL